MGLIDDFIDLKAVYKFIIQIAAALLVMFGGYLIDSLRLPFTDAVLPFGWAAYPLTLLWVVGIANAVNFIDGIDGLAGGFGVIASLFLGIVSIITGEATAAILSFALCGSLTAFLFFNFPPAKIFMGDSGSLFIGFVLAIIPLTMEGGRLPGFGLTPAITLLFLPILDTVAAVLRRIKRGVPIYRADKQHTHHKLMEAGFSPRGILGILYSLCIILGLTALLWPVLPRNNAFIINIVVWLICIAGLIVLDRLNKTLYSENSE
jgi:UDP-GlcNAc:undecaprenyl-phosphate GlcNAc-1-phosphate transferase